MPLTKEARGRRNAQEQAKRAALLLGSSADDPCFDACSRAISHRCCHRTITSAQKAEGVRVDVGKMETASCRPIPERTSERVNGRTMHTQAGNRLLGDALRLRLPPGERDRDRCFLRRPLRPLRPPGDEESALRLALASAASMS